MAAATRPKFCKPLPSEVRNIIRSGLTAPGIVKCVEELVLNSVDAEATKVNIKINLDTFIVQVEDDGSGIEKEDLEVVGTRYYTTKVRSLSDLNNLRTYGCRGESLASIVECSNLVEISTKSNSYSTGYSKKYKNGLGVAVRRAVEGRINHRGCTVYVQGLLARMPVRQKKLDKQMEIEEIKQMLEHLNLINPKLAITLRDDTSGAKRLQSKPVNSLKEALQRLYKQRTGIMHHEKILELKELTDVFEVAGVISQDSHQTRNMEFVFVNKRYIPKSRIYKLLEDQLSQLLGFGSRQSTSSHDSQDKGSFRKGKKSSPKPGFSGGERYPVFLINITCPMSEYTLETEDNKNKVCFQNTEALGAAIQAYAISFKRLLQSNNKPSFQQRVSAALMRGQASNSTEPAKDLHTARKVGERLTLHDMRGSVHSQPAIRMRKADLVPAKKIRIDSRDSDDDVNPSDLIEDTDESDPSPNLRRNYLRPVKSRTTANTRPTSRLHKTHTHDIRGLKKRKQARDSTQATLPSQITHKKPRLIDCSQPVETLGQHSSNATGHRPSSDAYSPDDSVFTGSHDDRIGISRIPDLDSDNDSEVSRRFSVLSVSASYCSAPRTDPRSVTEIKKEKKDQSPLNAYNVIQPLIATHNTPDYLGQIRKEMTNRIKANGSYEYFRALKQQFEPGPSSCENPMITPDYNRIQPLFTPAYYNKQGAKKQVEETFIPNKQRAFGFHQQDDNVNFAALNPKSSTFQHGLQKSVYFGDEVDTNQGFAPHQSHTIATDTRHGVTLRSKSKDSGSSKSDNKRHGKYISSQEFNIEIFSTDSPMEKVDTAPPAPLEKTSDVITVKVERNHTQGRTENWVSKHIGIVPDDFSPLDESRQKSSTNTTRAPTKPPPVFRKNISNPGETKGSESYDPWNCSRDKNTSSSNSGEEPFSQTLVSFSQQFPDAMRADHRREPTNIPDFDESDLFSEMFASGTWNSSQGNKSQLNAGNDPRRRLNFSDRSNSNLRAFNELDPEVPRWRASTGSSHRDSSSYYSTISTTTGGTSKYFKKDLSANENGDGIGEKIVLTHSHLEDVIHISPVVERNIPEMKVEEAAPVDVPDLILADQEQPRFEPESIPEGIPQEKESQVYEAILMNNQSSPNFRNSWLRKFFPEGAKNEWKREEGLIIKGQGGGNLHQLLNMKGELAETLRSCFTSDDDLVTNKWVSSSYEAASKALPTNRGGFEIPSFPWNVPLGNMNSREIHFWGKKDANDPQMSCRFSKEDLANVFVIGQVDRKFISTKISIMSGAEGNNNCGKQVLVLFDQHAVHERIRLEKLISDAQKDILDGIKGITSVEVTPPMFMNFTDTEVQVMDNFKKHFALIGVTLEVQKPCAIKILTTPKCFVKKISYLVKAEREGAIEQLLRCLLQEQVQNIIQTNGSPQPIPKTIMEVLKSAACKGAYKFGDNLSLETCVELMEGLKSCKAPFQCAHGRPVLVPLLNLQD